MAEDDRISVDALSAFFSHDSTCIIDVRDEDFDVGGHIPGARHCPSDSFAAGVGYLAREFEGDAPDTVVIHCQYSQVRGPACAQLLRAHTPHRPYQIRVLDGGFAAWNAKYGGRGGSSGFIAHVDATPRSKSTLQKFLAEVACDRGLACSGALNCMHCVDMQAADTLICWESVDAYRVSIHAADAHEHQVLYLSETAFLAHQSSHSGSESLEAIPLVQWLSANRSTLGASLELLSDDGSVEFQQFCKAFGGVGALLRHNVVLGRPPHETESPEASDSDF